MSNDGKLSVGSYADDRSEADARSVSSWATETKLVWTYDRPVDTAAVVTLAVGEAIEQWPELSDAPPLYDFVDVDNLGALFKRKAEDSGWLPSAEFQFQSCRVTVLYGSSLRVIINRNP
jgi:hypothetical protein